MNDWIERDAYGLFLAESIISTRKPARQIIKQTLPDVIKQDIEILEKHHNDELMIIDITTNLSIPAFLVSFTKQRVPVQPSGLGASLCKISALKQALYEAVQACDRYNQNTIESRNNTIRYYQDYPILLQAFRCDLQRLKHDSLVLDSPWENVTTHVVHPKLNQQVEIMHELMISRGCKLYYANLFHELTGLTLSYVLMVGAETFGMMREGVFTTIKKRGLEILK